MGVEVPNPSKMSNKTVITGGAGNFGFTLGRAFAKTGTHVILYDINQPPWEIPKGVVHIQADVRNYDDLYAACEGADCVIHAASYGMTGVEQVSLLIRSVNVGGTGVVLEVCKRRNVPRLIYTSSINVVFAGQTILDGDEASVPYYPLNKHRNEYSRTKSIAEQMVLAANGSFLAGGGKLYTCALRPPGIYGPEEQRHLPRLLIIERGFFLFKLGSSDVLMNWVHVKNLVQAHILAAAALTPEKNYIAVSVCSSPGSSSGCKLVSCNSRGWIRWPSGPLPTLLFCERPFYTLGHLRFLNLPLGPRLPDFPSSRTTDSGFWELQAEGRGRPVHTGCFIPQGRRRARAPTENPQVRCECDSTLLPMLPSVQGTCTHCLRYRWWLRATRASGR
uniref:Short chain dehydrogenase/reductase family 42E, member 2 n=1 Tax=Varanus komodoensis TaxID=61221 RepID=A0A8D2J6K5_VARKO